MREVRLAAVAAVMLCVALGVPACRAHGGKEAVGNTTSDDTTTDAADTGDFVPDPTGTPQFDPPAKTFVDDFSLRLWAVPETATIHYTTDGSLPSEDSSAYDEPIPITVSQRVRAVVLEGGVQLGPAVSQTYLRIDPDAQEFDSNLPIVIFDTFESGMPDPDVYEYIPGTMTVLEPVNGRTPLANRLAAVDSRIGIKVRGSSTRHFPKKSYAVETWNAHDEGADTSLLGLPAESDWVFYAPLNFDRAFVRNALIYELSNRIGRYAGRSRFVEVFLATENRPAIRAGDYVGVYVLMEKIKRDNARVSIAKMLPNAVSEPEVTGGYIIKIDRPGPGDQGFHAGGSQEFSEHGLQYVDPNEIDIVPDQADYIAQYIDEFAAAIDSPSYVNPSTDLAYDEYVDVDAWIDHHILNVLPKNPDALRLSAYMYKDREGRLAAGPIWDFDRTMGSYDGRDEDPEGWWGVDDSTPVFEYGWWGRLFENPEFAERYAARWVDLLDSGPLRIEVIDSIVDVWAVQLAEAAVRNYARWPDYPPRQGGHSAEIDHLKWWLSERVAWIRAQYP